MRNVSLMLILGTMLYPWNAGATCIAPPSCEELGFTMAASTCAGSALKCPWNLNKAVCQGAARQSTLQSLLPILYGDGTVSKTIVAGKTPIGIVFDETNRLAVALTDVDKKGRPYSERIGAVVANPNPVLGEGYNNPLLPDCDYEQNDSTVDSCEVDGRANTDKILASCSDCHGKPPAEACNNYEPAGCTKDFCKKNKWFLPSVRDFDNIVHIKGLVNDTLTLLSDFRTKLLFRDIGHYWTSNEATTSWSAIIQSSDYMRGDMVDELNYVRPVIYYGEPKKQEIAPILYGDGTVSKEIIPDKTPIGIVFDETNHLAIAPIDVGIYDSSFRNEELWSNNDYDIPSLVNCPEDESLNSCGVDGRANTDKILACGNDCGGTPAAKRVNNYEPAGCIKDFCKKTQWFLPSIKEWTDIYKMKKQLIASQSLLRDFGFEPLFLEKVYWSSNEHSRDKGWGFRMGNNTLSQAYKSYSRFHIRPVVKY